MMDRKAMDQRSGRFVARGGFRNFQKGMTLLELAVTMSVVAVLILAAVSSYSSYKDRSAIRGAQWLVYNLIVRARYEAVSQGRRIGTADLTASPTGTGLEAQTFSQWLSRAFKDVSFEVTPDSITFNGRGEAMIGQDSVNVVITMGSETRTITVDRGGMVHMGEE